MNVLTLDLGTTRFKAALFDANGRMLALAHRPTPIEQPQPGWSQIAAARLETIWLELADELRADHADAMARVGAISFATQTNSFLLLDERDQPLTPVILWTDRRAAQTGLTAPGQDDAHLLAETGVPQVSPQFMSAKLRWLREHEPAAWSQARRVRMIGDQLAWWLSGRHVTEAGAAALTGLLNIHTLQWRPGPLQQIHLDPHWLPTPARAGTDLGPLRPGLAQRLGVAEHCQAVLGCLDQYAGPVGVGAVSPGLVCETTGTVLATVTLAERFDPAPPPGVFQGPAWRKDRYWRMSFGSVSANLLEHLLRQQTDGADVTGLLDEAQAIPADCDGLQLDRAASDAAHAPVFLGQRPDHTRGHRVRAILEGVAAALKDQVQAVCGSQSPTRILAAGGAARSDLWLTIKARTLGLPVTATACPEPTSLGAAILALHALHTPAEPQALVTQSQTLVRHRRTFDPT